MVGFYPPHEAPSEHGYTYLAEVKLIGGKFFDMMTLCQTRT